MFASKTMSKQKVLIQVDPDTHASTFDSIVAIDAGVDQLLRHSSVLPEQIEGLVHGAMFTRGQQDLKSTALFFGGSDVRKTDALVEAAKKCFFGPMRVSILADPKGCNTTASAAVICAEKHLQWAGKTVTILGGTGLVSRRIAELIAGAENPQSNSTTIRICSRRLDKAKKVCQQLSAKTNGNFVPTLTSTPEQSLAAIFDTNAIFACGAAGAELLPEGWYKKTSAFVAIDLNAVPPAGIAGVEASDSSRQLESTVCYGAIAVGERKMKIHRRAIEMLFESNDLVLGAEQVYRLGKKHFNV